MSGLMYDNVCYNQGELGPVRQNDRVVACPFIDTAVMREHDVNAPLGSQFYAAVGHWINFEHIFWKH